MAPDQPNTEHCPLGCLFYQLSSGVYRALEAELPRLLGRPATIGDVAALHRQRRLRQIRHIGPRRLGEIEALLVVYGFNIAPRRPATHMTPTTPTALTEGTQAMTPSTLRTIAVRCRRNGRRWSRLRITYPHWATDDAHRPAYDVATARQLLALTAELPASKRGLLAVLTEYRHALHEITRLAESGPRHPATR